MHTLLAFLLIAVFPIFIYSVTCPFPTGGQLQEYIASLPQEAPLNFAVVDGGEVTMLSVVQGHIPDLTCTQQTKVDSGSKDGGGAGALR